MTNASIPASALADVIPGVLGPGGSPLALNAVFLTSDPSDSHWRRASVPECRRRERVVRAECA